jgi:dipeptidyl aminopeptidase/acylaminoacyl peptidase
LLIVGEADTNVPPESTYRVADALIKSGKTFDFLAVPGMGHSDGGPYGRKKKRDFFVKVLLGIDLPN